MCAISIGFCINSVPTIGVVFAPFIGGEGETFLQGHRPPWPKYTRYSILCDSSPSWGSMDVWIWALWTSNKPPPSFTAATSPWKYKRVYAITSFTSSLADRMELRCIYLGEWGKDRRDFPGSNLEKRGTNFMNMAAEIGARNGRGGMVHGIRSLGR